MGAPTTNSGSVSGPGLSGMVKDTELQTLLASSLVRSAGHPISDPFRGGWTMFQHVRDHYSGLPLGNSTHIETTSKQHSQFGNYEHPLLSLYIKFGFCTRIAQLSSALAEPNRVLLPDGLLLCSQDKTI
uniref:TFR_dimer domain-containing protein n=1 Tax=Panagrellus redivivus TaxID=6233 RepID=A0A7E4V6Y7_PANRE